MIVNFEVTFCGVTNYVKNVVDDKLYFVDTMMSEAFRPKSTKLKRINVLEITNNKNVTEGVIEIILNDSDDQVSIQIKDNGIGFPSTDTDKLLEPYYTTREMGTGIGLSVVKNIIEVHKGQIKLDNNLSENSTVLGATVTLLIPKTLSIDSETMNDK